MSSQIISYHSLVYSFDHRQVLIYEDKGVNHQGVEALKRQLARILDSSIKIKKVDSNYLKNQDWENKTIALFIGGGECREWDKNLGEEGIKKIHDYVLNGGKYLGICAGAYFAAAESRFQLLNQLPIERKRALGFFSGKAIGPLLETQNHLSLQAAQAVKISLLTGEETQKGYLYYQGGCFFDIEQDSNDTHIIARYKNLSPNRAAAINCKFGKGCAFLCGLHPEFKWSKKLDDQSNHHFTELKHTLSANELFRKKVWQEIAKNLDLPTKDFSNNAIQSSSL